MMVEFPTDSEIQFLVAGNNAEIMESILLQEALNHCDNNLETYVNSIKVVQNFYPDHVKIERSIVERRLPPVPNSATGDDVVDDDVESVKTALTSDEPEINNNHVLHQVVTADINTIHHRLSANYNANDANDANDAHHHKHQALCDNIEPEIQDFPVGESHYEEIPGDVGIAPRQEAEDEHGYLIPVHIYPKAGRGPPVMPKPKTERLTDENGYLKQVRTTNQLPENVTEMIDKHLRERLDKFLIDSVQEFQRIQFQHDSDDVSRDTNYRDRSDTDPSPETKEDLNRYLETLFDCDKMTQQEQQMAPRPRYKRLHSMPGIWDFPPGSYHTEDQGRGHLRRNSTTGGDIQLPKGYRTPIRFSLSNPDATLRRHNLDQVLKPIPRNLEFSDDSAFEMPTRFGFESRRSGVVTPSGVLDDEHGFMPIDHPPVLASTGSRLEEFPSPGDDADADAGSSLSRGGHASDTEPRTDSGIFISCPVWNDPYAMDSDSPYRTGSEGSSWSPPGDVSNATVQEVAQCLQYIGMRDHIVKHFYDEQIDGKQLLELNEHLLSEGFPQLNALDRKKIVDFVNGWRPKKL